MSGVGGIGVGGLARRHEMVGERTPGFGVGRLQAQHLAQRGDGGIPLPGRAERQRALVEGGKPLRAFLQQRVEQRQRGGGIATATLGGGLQQSGRGVAGDGGEDLARLRVGERGILLEQTQRLRHRDLEGAGGGRCIAHARHPSGNNGRPTVPSGVDSGVRRWSRAQRLCVAP